MKNKITLTSEIKYQLLRDISNQIRGTLDLDKILNLLLDLLSESIDYDAAGIFILSEDIDHPGYHIQKQKIASMAQRGFGNLPPESDAMLMEGKGIIGHTIKSGKNIILNDVLLDDRYIPGRKETRSEIAVPILREGKTIGALNVESDKLNAFGIEDIEVLNFFAEASAISIEKALLHYQTIEKRKIEEQLKIAKDIQMDLLPGSSPVINNYDFASVCIPAYDIGGDYFDYIFLDDERIAILVADVSGDGISAALIMAAFRALLRFNARNYSDPAELMKLLNENVNQFMRRRDFITIFYAILNFKTHKIFYCNCGHYPALFYSAQKIHFLQGEGPSLNLVKDASFKSYQLDINKDDQLLLFTDGVIEVFNQEKKQFGINRLIKVFENNLLGSPQHCIHRIISATKEFGLSDFYSDDFTIVLFKRTG